MHTGDIIKFLRNQKNLTQSDLSKILGVNVSSIQKYESGAVSNLKMETIRTLCNYFNLSPIVFIFPEEIGLDSLFSGIYVKGKFTTHMEVMRSLNTRGVEKVMAYTLDLADNENYKKSRKIQDKVKMK